MYAQFSNMQPNYGTISIYIYFDFISNIFHVKIYYCMKYFKTTNKPNKAESSKL